VELLCQALGGSMGDDFLDLFRMTISDGGGEPSARGFCQVGHQDIEAFESDVEDFLVKRRRSSFVAAWPPVLVVAYHPLDEETVSAMIAISTHFVIGTRTGDRVEYRLVSHIRRPGPAFGGHATARVRADAGEYTRNWRFVDDDREVRNCSPEHDGRVTDSVRVGFFLRSEYWRGEDALVA
jgi:hypothetical protein